MSKAKKIWIVGNYLLGCATLGAGLGYGVAVIVDTVQKHIRHKKVEKAIKNLGTMIERLKDLQEMHETDTEDSEET